MLRSSRAEASIARDVDAYGEWVVQILRDL